MLPKETWKAVDGIKELSRHIQSLVSSVCAHNDIDLGRFSLSGKVGSKAITCADLTEATVKIPMPLVAMALGYYFYL